VSRSDRDADRADLLDVIYWMVSQHCPPEPDTPDVLCSMGLSANAAAMEVLVEAGLAEYAYGEPTGRIAYVRFTGRRP
jgi:hypothetical protein